MVLRAIVEIVLKPSVELRQLAKEALSNAPAPDPISGSQYYPGRRPRRRPPKRGVKRGARGGSRTFARRGGRSARAPRRLHGKVRRSRR